MRKFLTGLSVLVAGHAMAGEKPPEITNEQFNPTPISTPEIKTDPMNNSEVVAFAAEQEHQVQIKKLEQKKTKLESELQKLTGDLQGQQADFIQRYKEVMEFAGKEIPKGKGKKGAASLISFPLALADSAMKAGRERVGGKANITSDANVEGLTGILLSQDGSLSREVGTLEGLLSGSMGATTHQRQVNEQTGQNLDVTDPIDSKKVKKQQNDRTGFGVTGIGGTNEDLDQHQSLGAAPKKIIKLALEIVHREHQLELVQADLDALMGVPPDVAQGEIPTVTF